MLRYYMTAETREALIAESNRLIAARAATHPSRRRAAVTHDGDASDTEWSNSEGDTELPPSSLDSAFARLVADIRAASAGGQPSPHP